MFFKKKKETTEEITRALIDKCLEILLTQLPEKRMPNGHILPYFVCFDVPGTKNEAFLRMERMDDNVSFQVHVLRSGTFRSYSNFLHSCHYNDIEKYLRDEVDREQIYDSVVHLSEDVDEYWA